MFSIEWRRKNFDSPGDCLFMRIETYRGSVFQLSGSEFTAILFLGACLKKRVGG